MTCQCDTIPVPKFTPEYTPTGKHVTVEGKQVYVTGNPEAKYALVCIYDIFGFHKNVYQGADYLGSLKDGPIVVMPDYFEGDAVPVDMTPAQMAENFQSWMGKHSPPVYLSYTSKLIDWIASTYPSVKVTGLYGFCWGAKLAILAAQNKMVGAISLIHPSRLAPEDTVGIEDMPVLIIATNGEKDEDLQPVVTKLNKVDYVRFDDVHHGFAAARGDWGVELQKKRAEEALLKTNEFFVKSLL